MRTAGSLWPVLMDRVTVGPEWRDGESPWWCAPEQCEETLKWGEQTLGMKLFRCSGSCSVHWKEDGWHYCGEFCRCLPAGEAVIWSSDSLCCCDEALELLPSSQVQHECQYHPVCSMWSLSRCSSGGSSEGASGGAVLSLDVFGNGATSDRLCWWTLILHDTDVDAEEFQTVHCLNLLTLVLIC